jgi:hypothetical protein
MQLTSADGHVLHKGDTVFVIRGDGTISVRRIKQLMENQQWVALYPTEEAESTTVRTSQCWTDLDNLNRYVRKLNERRAVDTHGM